MANVQLNWTAAANPDSNGIENQVVYRFPGSITDSGLLSAMGLSSSDISDGEGSNPTDKQITGLTAAQAASFAGHTDVTHLTNGNELAKDASSYTDINVTSGSAYVYGVFSKNSVGIGPGELQQQTV